MRKQLFVFEEKKKGDSFREEKRREERRRENRSGSAVTA